MQEQGNAFTELGGKWFSAALGAYILGRALAVFIVPGFQETILSTDTQFGDIFGLDFMYIMGTFGLPLVLAALTTEVATGHLNSKLFKIIVFFHMLSAIFAGVASILGNIGSQPCGFDQGGPSETCQIMISTEIFIRGLAVTIGAPVVASVAILWEKKKWRIFNIIS